MYAIVKRLDDLPEGYPEVFPIARIKDVIYNRMTPTVYDALVKELPQIAVNNETSPMQAGVQLGVQLVLKKIRDGYLHAAP